MSIRYSSNSNLKPVADVSTNVIGGIGSVTSLSVSGISTLGVTSITDLTSQNLNVSGVTTVGFITASDIISSGVVTATTFIGNLTGTATTATTAGYASTAGISTYATSSGIATYASTAGVSTSVIGGIGSITQLQVTGVSTFTNGPIFIGAATSTGTANQILQVTGGAYVSGSVGVGTTNPIQPVQVGSAGTNVVVVDLIGEVGIGTTNPTSKLHVVGDIKIDDGGTYTTTVQTITPTANRVLSFPDATGTIALVAGSNTQVIYNNSGANAGDTGLTYNNLSKSLTVGGATTTTSSPILNLSQTWNSGSVTFTGVQLNITDTASAAASLLMDWQVGGASRFEYTKSGLSYYYNTSTDVTNYERAKIGWESNILRVGTEKLGTGVARGLELQTDGTTRVSVGATTGSVTIPSVGVASTAILNITGTWTTGAGTTNTKPAVLIEPVGTISTTWSNSGTGLGINATSGFAGNLLDLQVNGTPQFKLSSSGTLITITGGTNQLIRFNNITNCTELGGNGVISLQAFNNAVRVKNEGVWFGAVDSNWNAPYLLVEGGTGASQPILAQRNGTNAQTFRIYNTYTDGSNYERGKLEWSGNVFRVGTERLGTGSTANTRLDLQTDGTTRVAISTSGSVGIGTTNPLVTLDVRGNTRITGISTFSSNVDIAGTVGIGTIIDIIPYDTLNSGTLSWEGSAGQLFSITNNLTSGSIFSVNDVSGIPSIDVNVDGTVVLTPYADGNVGIATTRPTSRLHVIGDSLITGISTSSSIVVNNNLTVAGFSSINDTRLNSVSEESTIAIGNTVSLVYNTGGGNIGIVTNPSGPITLNVTGIPTDSSFNNRSLTFSVIVNQGATGYACSTVTLNGLTTSVRFPGGVVAVGATSAYDIFNFTCINPVGSASTTANYVVLGVVNGNFK